MSDTSSRYLVKKQRVSDFVVLVRIVVSNGDFDRVVFVKIRWLSPVCLVDNG